jgi:small conductance mechanosensitive channel
MRCRLAAPLLAALFLLAAPPASRAQTLPLHQAAAAATTTPAKATASAIIPGSPLAALTSGAPAADTGATPPPFGTDGFGLPVMSKLVDEAGRSVDEFGQAVHRSTALTPVLQWLESFAGDPSRRVEAAGGAMAVLITLLPALLVEYAIRLLLQRPRLALINRARAARNKILARLTESDATEGLAHAEAGETEELPRPKLNAGDWLVRIALSAGYVLLALAPLGGFIATGIVVLAAGFITTTPSHLILSGTANAYLVCRIGNGLLRFIYAPDAQDLRLIHTTDRRARWLVTTFSAMLIIGAAGFVLVSTGEILGLPHSGALVIGRLVALVLHIQVAILVWQSRRIVAGWIRGKPGSTGTIANTRYALAAIWHYLALFYILTLWIALAGGVQNAFGLLLRIILVFIAAMVFGRLIWLLVANGLDRLLNAPATEEGRHPTLRARAKVYHPLISLLLRIIIIILGIVFMLQGWGLNILPWLMTDALSRSLIAAFIAIIITIALALTAWEMTNYFLNSRIERLAGAGRTRQASRLRTLQPMLRATIGTAIFLGASLICLGKIGVNLVPLLAVSGVAGIAIGFGSQKLVQDIITGLFLLLEDAMQVGDVVSLASMTGTVEKLSIRTIRLRGGDGSINIIPFSAVTTVTNMTRDFGYAQISIQVEYDANLDHVYKVLTDIGHKMRAEPAWGAMMRDDLQIFGLDQFGASALVITGQIRTGPGQHWAVRREFYARVKRRFAEEHIEMPYTYLPPAPPPAQPAAPPALEPQNPAPGEAGDETP